MFKKRNGMRNILDMVSLAVTEKMECKTAVHTLQQSKFINANLKPSRLHENYNKQHGGVQSAGPALSRCNRCSCIGPRASGGPAPCCLGRLFIFARYTVRLRIQ